MQVAVYLSDGETWDTVEGCELAFYDNEDWEWGDGPKPGATETVSLKDVLATYLQHRGGVQ